GPGRLPHPGRATGGLDLRATWRSARPAASEGAARLEERRIQDLEAQTSGEPVMPYDEPVPDLLLVEVLRKPRRRRVAPGRHQRWPHSVRRRGLQANLGATASAPGAVEGLKDLRLLPHELLLLVRRQLDHAPGLVRSKSREDLAANPKIRMLH